MFTSISWQQYLQALLIASVIYYLIILMLYYKREVRRWVRDLGSRRGRRSRLGKFISGRTDRTDKDASAIISSADPHESSDEIDGVSDTNENQITHE